MTEVRAESLGGSGLFATQDYQIGDQILQENTPLIHLAPTTKELESAIVGALVEQTIETNPAGTTDDDKRSLWRAIQVPASIKEAHYGKFKGMVQAALCFAASEVSVDSKQRFLKLYCPPLTTTEKSPSANSEAEADIIEVSKQALQYVKENIRIDSNLAQNGAMDDGTLQKVMLLWSGNSFEGGRVYDSISRINHSCDPNAVVQLGLGTEQDRQSIVACAPIANGDEITISYLGLLLYADRPTRQASLLGTKHFTCACDRCKTSLPDNASAIPCPICHPRRTGQRQLDEDVQYDDEQSVHYAMIRQTPDHNAAQKRMECEHCHAKIFPSDSNHAVLWKIATAVTDKTVTFLRDHAAMEKNKLNDDGDDEEAEQVREELLEQQLQICSSVLGAQHWTTNILLLLLLDQKLQALHGGLLSDNQGEADLGSIAEAMDMLERLFRYVNRLGLRLHRGHLLADVTMGAARALVSLGDTGSQKYAAEWMAKVDDYVQSFEPEDVQKVAHALKAAWTRADLNPSPRKRAKGDVKR